jgi:D-inositol-3-phosphate glycosyltransferase
MASHYESFGLVGLEALACGRPVISTSVGAMDRLIRESRAGQIVADTSPQSLAAGIQSVLTNQALPTADAIRASILDYGWHHVADAILAQYETALSQHPHQAVFDIEESKMNIIGSQGVELPI